MRKILCFGDSNTFGFNPQNGRRFDKNIRWGGVLAQLLGENYKIIEAGCNNRTAFQNNPCGQLMTGYKVLPVILQADLDLIVLNLGINDLQKIYSTTKNDIEVGITRLIQIVKEKSPNSKILLIAPNHITKNILKSSFCELFDENSILKSEWLASIYEKIARKESCDFLNMENLVEVSAIDGLHYDEIGHKKLHK